MLAYHKNDNNAYKSTTCRCNDTMQGSPQGMCILPLTPSSIPNKTEYYVAGMHVVIPICQILPTGTCANEPLT